MFETLVFVRFLEEINCWFQLSQIENEYGNIDSAYGPAAKTYIKWAANMAVSLDTGVPWVMCQQADAPSSVVRLSYSLSICIVLAFYKHSILSHYAFLQINTCNGFYCDQFTPNSNSTPKMWTENWSGW